jgi:hypothetical protein
VLPSVFTFAVAFFVASVIAAEAHFTSRLRQSPWWWYDLVTRIQTSPNRIERRSMYMGRVAADASPVLAPRAAFGEHAHFLGDSGSGKSSQALCPISEQFVLGCVDQLSPENERDKPCSLIVIDLKSDTFELHASLLYATRLAREILGIELPHCHFTNEIGQPTYAFNPLRQSFLSQLSISQKTDILCNALGVTYGTEYGEGFFSAANKNVVFQALRQNPNPCNFVELYRLVDRLLAPGKGGVLLPDEQRAAIHVKMVLHGLAAVEALNVSPGGKYDQQVLDHAIDLADAFAEPRTYYFRLATARGRSAAGEIGRLVIFSLLTAASCCERKTRVYVIIDEFQEMVSGNLSYILRVARSMDIGVILANQSMDDLKTSTVDLIPILETNCRIRQWFSVSSVAELERVRELSGDTVDQRRSVTRNPDGDSVTHQEVVVPRLTVNKLKLASDDEHKSVFMLKRGGRDGYAQYGGFPFIAETDYHISKQEYERRKAAGLEEGPGTFRATLDGDDDVGDGRAAIRRPRPEGGPAVGTDAVSPGDTPEGSSFDPFESYFAEKGL